MDKSDMKETESKIFFWGLRWQADERIISRSNLLLVAESVFFAGAVASKGNDISSMLVLSIAGLFVASLWILVNLKLLIVVRPFISEKLIALDPEFKSLKDKFRKWPSSNWLIGVVLPIGIFVLWVIWVILSL